MKIDRKMVRWKARRSSCTQSQEFAVFLEMLVERLRGEG